MTALQKEAVQMIEKMTDDDVMQVIAFIKNIKVTETSIDDRSRAMRGLEILKSFAGTLSKDFDYKKELAEAREEKFRKNSCLHEKA